MSVFGGFEIGSSLQSVRLLIATMLAVMLVACGGGSGSKGKQVTNVPEVETDGTNPVVSTGANLNPAYAGYLYLSHRGRSSMLDLASGKIYGLRPSATEPFHVTPDAKNFVTYYDDFDSPEYDDRLIDWFSGDGTTYRNLQVFSDLYGVPKLSADGSLLAIGSRNKVADGYYLNVINQNNNVVFARNLDSEKFPFTSWEWLANGDLIFSEMTDLYRVSGLATANPVVTFLYSLPQPPYHIAVSPDQSKISFSMYSGDTNHHIYVMNLDSGAYRQLTDSDTDESGASWSPDGKYIAFNNGEDFVMCDSWSDCISDCPLVYIAASDSDKIWVSEDQSNQAYQVKIYQENEITSVCSREQLEWRNRSVPIASSLGTSPAPGNVGHGYAGTLIFEGGLTDNVVDQLTLDTMYSNPIPSRYDDPDIMSTAKDGQSMALVIDSSETDYNEKIFIRDREGNDLEILNLDDTIGVPKLSPNGKWLAVEFHDTSIGDEPTIRMVSVFKRVPGTQHTPEFESRFRDFNGWEWTSDDRLVLVRGNLIYVTDSGLTQAELYMTLPNRVESLRVSPDNKTLAFVMQGHIWKIDFRKYDAGSETPRRVTISSAKETAVAWSYDSKALAFTHQDSLSKCHDLYIVPADGENVYVANEKYIATSAQPVLLPRGDGKRIPFCTYSGILDWVR